MVPGSNFPIYFALSLTKLLFLFFQERALAPTTFSSKRSWSRHNFFDKKAVALSSFSAEKLMPYPFFRKLSHCPSRTSKPRLILTNFKSSCTRYDTHYVTYTLKLCLFYTYGDICSPWITFMGTWISFKFIVFISNPDINWYKIKIQTKHLLSVSLYQI